MRGGGSKAVWNFSEKSSDLAQPPFPQTVMTTRAPAVLKILMAFAIPPLMNKSIFKDPFPFCYAIIGVWKSTTCQFGEPLNGIRDWE